MFLWWAIVPITFTAIGIWGLNYTLAVVPARYDALERRGVPATATFAGCGRDCSLRMTFRGVSRSWDYNFNHGQFDDLERGADVAVIVDPRNPSTVQTATDVRERTNAGFGLVLVLTATVGLIGLAGFPVLYVFARNHLREWDDGGSPMGLAGPEQPRTP